VLATSAVNIETLNQLDGHVYPGVFLGQQI